MAEPMQLDNGKWRIRIRYKDPFTNDWSEKMFTRKTRKLCKEAEVDFLSKIMKGENLQAVKLLEFYDMWVDTFKKGKVTDGRLQKIAITRKNLSDFFGENQTLRGITKLKYQQWINWLAAPGNANARGLAIETVSNRHNIVKSMFIEALDMQYIHNNPTRNIHLTGQKPVHKSNKTIMLDDLKQFKEELLKREDSTSKFFVLTQMYTGARYQEVAALKWSDLNVDKETITIERAFKYDAGNYRFGSTKSDAGVREVDVPSILFQYLNKHRLQQKEQLLSRKFYNPNDLIFVNDKNTWPVSNSAVNKYIKETCERANIDRISTHSFRHARSDFLILAEADPIYIKTQLGHKEITQSYEYASATQANRNKNKTKYESYFKDIL